MDRSLDEIIAERPQRQNRGQNRGPRNQGRRSNGVKKPYRDERVDLDLDWVHDKYEDDRDTRPSRGGRRPRVDRYSPSPDRSASAGTRLRIENLHYDITETDLEELFSRIGPISNVSLVYDRAGRSEGVAYVTYSRYNDAKTAIAEFDGANAKGQPIRISITSSGPRRDRNPFDTAEKPRGSLFDRVERPRDARSLSPESRSESAEGAGRRRRRRGGGGGNYRRSDVSKPAPDHIDRYIPGQQAPARRAGGGRRQGGDGRRGNPRPKKTQEELDQEMEDYWGSNAAAETAEQAAAPEQTAAEPAPAASAVAAPAAAAAPAADDDIDMIE
ncbi:hypothetical protein AN7706.2 [Aspergillus nidulans FGSC A4]|uniref:RNA binding protein, putative (AFU_orthologue AFUA_5G08310) n=1 Tax=Emericella nidulans (strain FGSC A4 / ATCC 38163 / CBS 112.46 / NRRL 194 / M139) TaxID=227321 RepID=Q5AVH4_EMENI|nr:hypothetical protein [Aspergillus nidulans FGSC A4]EAA61221.1 hypothetical protein AN7706.2 [Aspergillus nidulans FGSC A4]CBF79945.1 TPA: RNA binding protein, putative (AFU_orthologue; AFUA_5G08310) [Aspergillus nidulans FGSC A4]|eukprot:XP_680975.1 hypothetical protein AN7706.2 [Aspergillus nidulans FGSC A4]